MSTQSIHNKDRNELIKRIDVLFIKMGRSYFLKHRFNLGKSYCKETYLKLSSYRKILCKEDCRNEIILGRIKENLNKVIIVNNA